MPALEISATDIRERCAEGKSIRYLLPDAVAHYIHSHNLYHNMLTIEEKTKAIVAALEDIKATNITVLDTSKLSSCSSAW